MTAVEDPERNALRGFFGKVGRIFTGRDSETLSPKLDRRSTLLLQAARRAAQSMDERSLTAIEDPGIDALRGSFGTVGSIIRARSARRLDQSGHGSSTRVTGAYDPTGLSWASDRDNEIPGLPLIDPLSGLKRHQLYDAPVPKDDSDTSSTHSVTMNSTSSLPKDSQLKRPTIRFDSQDVIHQYDRPGTGDNRATHSHRAAQSTLWPNDSDSPSSNTLEAFPSVTESWRNGVVWDDEELERQRQLAKARDRAQAVGEQYLKTNSDNDAEEIRRLFRRQSGGNELHDNIEIQATLNSANLQLKSEQDEKMSGTPEQHPTTDLPENNENLLGRGLDSVADSITSQMGVVPAEGQSIDQKVDFDIQEIWKFFFILTLVILMYFARE